ncbi:MAG: hypothetical protein QW480_00700 [Candidatus Aenigmatarchaeota archaeon]
MILERIFKIRKKEERKEASIELFSANLLLPTDENFIKDEKSYENAEIVSEKVRKRTRFLINKKDVFFIIVEIILIIYLILGALGIVPLF